MKIRDVLAYSFVLSLDLAFAAYAQTAPKITISSIQTSHDDPVELRGTGFSANKYALSHLKRPNGTDYPILPFVTNDRGEFSHTLDSTLLSPGIHELVVIDEKSNARSNMVRFVVGFEEDSPVLPEVEKVLDAYVGVWQGNGERNSPPRQTSIVVTIAGRKAGSIAGTISYPSLSCGAVLEYRAIHPESLVLMETSMYGLERCPGGGITILNLGADGVMQFQWRDPKLPGIAAGKLTLLKK